eukprot:326584-Pyramimonas_sp.AAC.1
MAAWSVTAATSATSLSWAASLAEYYAHALPMNLQVSQASIPLPIKPSSVRCAGAQQDEGRTS